jgi:hypothetical protein
MIMNNPMRILALAVISCTCVVCDAADRQSIIVAVGAAGTEEYGTQFAEWSDAWEEVAAKADAEVFLIGRESNDKSTDFELLNETIAKIDPDASEPLWIVFIGHGTFDGREAKFNLRGPDVTAATLHEWLKPVERTVVLINCASASSPFMNKLAGQNRIVVTSTKNGYQYNFARFGKFIAAAIGNPDADLDKDGQTSLLEAFLLASSGVTEFYSLEARLATETALLDDNGDGLGTPADWFRGVRAVQTPKNNAPVDGLRANQLHLVRSVGERNMSAPDRQKRDELESQIAALRERKSDLDEDDYYRQLETILLQLARLYQSLDGSLP